MFVMLSVRSSSVHETGTNSTTTTTNHQSQPQQQHPTETAASPFLQQNQEQQTSLQKHLQRVLSLASSPVSEKVPNTSPLYATTDTLLNNCKNNLKTSNHCNNKKNSLTLNNLHLNNSNSSNLSSHNNNCNNNNNTNNNNNNKKQSKCLKSPSISIGNEIFLKPRNNSVDHHHHQQLPGAKFLSLTELNNFRKKSSSSPVQVPVATILNDLSPVPVPAKVTNQHQNALASMSPPMTLKGLHNNTPDAKAMRYYRLWIYTCNAVLFMAVIVFCGVAGKVLLADYKRVLINGLNLGQPSFMYAYLALLVQSGFLQMIGCFGALRLSEKLLNAYWLLLLLLLIGDAILGVFWMFKFEGVVSDLQKTLRNRLSTEYGTANDFTELWDRLQIEERCCGVTGPQDFTMSPINRSYPLSCCSVDVSDPLSVSRRPLASPVIFRTDDDVVTAIDAFADDSTPPLSTITADKSNVISSSSLQLKATANLSEPDSSWNHILLAAKDDAKSSITMCRAVYPVGCADRLNSWLKSTADILFVLGYCVIAFLKLSFLGILRYEIREMIQKIKLLQTEMATAILCVDGEQQIQQTQQQFGLQTQNTITSLNGGIRTEPKVGNRDRERTRVGSGESEMESLLLHHETNNNNNNNTTPKYNLKHKQLFICSGAGRSERRDNLQPQVDLDSGSNCALIVDEFGGVPQQQQPLGLGQGSAGEKTISENNYELSEFDTKPTNYRLLNAPTVTKI